MTRLSSAADARAEAPSSTYAEFAAAFRHPNFDRLPPPAPSARIGAGHCHSRGGTADAGLMANSPEEVTRLLEAVRAGEDGALDRLVPLVYDELRRIAASYARRERVGHTLQPTALVNEAYMRLADSGDKGWQNRAHVLAVAAQTMRHILVDYARARRAEKRGGDLARVTLDEALAAPARDVDLLALDDALARLAALDPELARLVELRYFGGLTIRETSEVLRVSPKTVEREWETAKLWLRREVSGGEST